MFLGLLLNVERLRFVAIFPPIYVYFTFQLTSPASNGFLVGVELPSITKPFSFMYSHFSFLLWNVLCNALSKYGLSSFGNQISSPLESRYFVSLSIPNS